MGPQGEKKMKNTLFATIALAVATMPLTFAAQAPKVASPAGTPASASTPSTTAKKATKKSTKKSTKTVASVSKPAATTVSKPAVTPAK